MPHRFFTSYARSDNNRVSGLAKVIDELRERVRAKLGTARAEEVGYFDTTAIDTGQDWERALGDAVSKAHVLVCFCSPSYFNSEYCARELEIFRRRVDAAGKAFEGTQTILPVIWDLGTGAGWMPRSMERYQHTSARLPSEYRNNGLCVLRRVRRLRGHYTATIEELARIIATAAEERLPPYGGVLRFDQLPGVFHDPTPHKYNAAVLVLHEDRMRWKPSSSETTIGRLVGAVASDLRIGWREIVASDQPITELRAARDRREASIVLTTEGAAQSPAWAPLAQALDQEQLENCALLVDARPPGNAEVPLEALSLAGALGGRTGEADALLAGLFPQLVRVSRYRACFSFESEDRLRGEMARAIESVRLALIDGDPAARVEVDEKGGSGGFDRNPILAGPGGGVR